MVYPEVLGTWGNIQIDAAGTRFTGTPAFGHVPRRDTRTRHVYLRPVEATTNAAYSNDIPTPAI